MTAFGRPTIPGTTPSAADDDGTVDPSLAALLAGDDTRAVGVALLGARVLLPVVAVRAAAEADMTVPALVDASGRRALPVFSSYDALRAWREDARPVPMTGARALAAAAGEGYAAVVLDVAGPHAHAFDGDDLRVLGDAATALLAHPAASVVQVPPPPGQ